MLTDHLSMRLADLVSADALFDSYRRWILNQRPFATVEAELQAISATAAVERRLFEQSSGDELGRFGRFADAFDVSTAMPLILYLATEADLGDRLGEALGIVESYILRRDICGLTTKNYNRFFVGTITRLREAEGDTVAALSAYFAGRTSDIDKWPSDADWRIAWLGNDQYKSARQPRLRYVFEGLEAAKRSALSEDIEIKSALTVEHIMPQKWRTYWPVPGFDHILPGEVDVDHMMRELERDAVINKLGNLTLLTHSLNTSVSHGAFATKLPAVRAHASLALNRELNAYDKWDEETISQRGAALFEVARKIWAGPVSATEYARA